MTNITSKYLDSLIDSISTDIKADTIYLFGSQAYGVPSDESDIDLCVITSDTEKRKREITRAIRKSISPILSMPIDILVYHANDFYERAAIASSIEHEILDKGVKLYG